MGFLWRVRIMHPAIPLADYIKRVFDGNNAAFARHYALCRQNVKGMIDGGYVVVNGVIFRPMAHRS